MFCDDGPGEGQVMGEGAEMEEFGGGEKIVDVDRLLTGKWGGG